MAENENPTTDVETPEVETEKEMPKVSLKALVNAIAEERDTKAADEGKRTRNYIRRHFDDLLSDWNGLEEAKSNRDGNRYPPMPYELAADLFETLTATREAKKADEVEETEKDHSNSRG
jgi:hypothetical protein